MRATWLRAGSSTGSIPSGTRSGSACDRGEPQVGRRAAASSRSSERHVGLVAGALAAEHVGVDHDERPLTRRLAVHGRRVACATSLPVEGARALRGRAAAAPRAVDRLAAGRPRSRPGRADRPANATPPRELLERRPVAGRDDGRAAGHRLEHRQPEALVERDVGDRRARRGRAARAPRRRRRRASDAVAVDLDAAPAGRAGDEQRRPFRPARRKPSSRRGRFFRGSSVETAST